MNAAAEGHMRIGAAGNVQVVRGGEHFRIPVGGGYYPAHPVAFPHPLPVAQIHILRGDALYGLQRRVVAQNFLHGVDDVGVRVRAQQVKLRRMIGEGQRSVGNQVVGGFMAGHQQQQSVGQHLIAGVRPHKLAPADDGQQVVAGLPHPFRHDGRQVIGNRLDALGKAANPIRLVAVKPAHPPAQLLDKSAVAGGNVHQAGDDAVSQRRGEIVHHIHTAGAL